MGVAIDSDSEKVWSSPVYVSSMIPPNVTSSVEKGQRDTSLIFTFFELRPPVIQS